MYLRPGVRAAWVLRPGVGPDEALEPVVERDVPPSVFFVLPPVLIGLPSVFVGLPSVSVLHEPFPLNAKVVAIPVRPPVGVICGHRHPLRRLGQARRGGLRGQEVQKGGLQPGVRQHMTSRRRRTAKKG
jgi:hypothetical protein